MSWNPTSFKVAFPEFANATADIIQPAIDAAYSECFADVYGIRLDEAVGQLAAHILANSPFARTMKLESVNDDSGKPTTKYHLRYEQIRFQVAGPLKRFVL